MLGRTVPEGKGPEEMEVSNRANLSTSHLYFRMV